MRFTELVPILQMAIGPVILISGVGLLLLSMTNRLGRVIDRARQISDALRHAPQLQRSRLAAQLPILVGRARLIRLSITLASLSVLLAALLIITLFVSAVRRLEAAFLIAILFITCLGALIGSMMVFILDVYRSLAALEHEIEVEQD